MDLHSTIMLLLGAAANLQISQGAGKLKIYMSKVPGKEQTLQQCCHNVVTGLVTSKLGCPNLAAALIRLFAAYSG